MNLNNYDNVETVCGKTWIDPTYKYLYSKEIKYHSSYTILQRYNKKENCYDFFLVLSNNPDNSHLWNCVTRTKSGTIKINLNHVWHVLPIKNNINEFDVNIKEVDKDDESVIYYLDI